MWRPPRRPSVAPARTCLGAEAADVGVEAFGRHVGDTALVGRARGQVGLELVPALCACCRGWRREGLLEGKEACGKDRRR